MNVVMVQLLIPLVLDFTTLQCTSQEDGPLPVNINKLWRREAEFRSPAGNWQQGKLTTGHVRRRRKSCLEVEGDLVRPHPWTAPATSTALRMQRRRMACKNQQRSSSDLQVPGLKPAPLCFLYLIEIVCWHACSQTIIHHASQLVDCF